MEIIPTIFFIRHKAFILVTRMPSINPPPSKESAINRCIGCDEAIRVCDMFTFRGTDCRPRKNIGGGQMYLDEKVAGDVGSVVEE